MKEIEEKKGGGMVGMGVSDLGVATRTLPQIWRAAHPDVDTTGKVFRFEQDEEGFWIITGVEEPDPRKWAAMNRCCCHPHLERGHEDVG